MARERSRAIPTSRGVHRDPEAERAASEADIPDPAPDMAGESALDEPSRAEVFARNPRLATEEQQFGDDEPPRGHHREEAPDA